MVRNLSGGEMPSLTLAAREPLAELPPAYDSASLARTVEELADPALEGDLYRFAAERGLPVLIHFGFLGRGGGVVDHPRMSPLTLFQVARDFPEIPFVIPHFGAGYWRKGKRIYEQQNG